MDGHDRLGAPAQLAGHVGGVDEVGRGVDIREDRHRPEPRDGARRGEERVAGQNHLVRGANVEGHECQEQGVAAGRAGDGVGNVEGPGERGLEFGDFRAEHEPSGIAHFLQRGPDLVAEHGVLPVERQEWDGGEQFGVRGLLRRRGVFVAHAVGISRNGGLPRGMPGSGQPPPSNSSSSRARRWLQPERGRRDRGRIAAQPACFAGNRQAFAAASRPGHARVARRRDPSGRSPPPSARRESLGNLGTGVARPVFDSRRAARPQSCRVFGS